MTTTETILDLDGIEVDNLLAFLALLGTLRALEAVRADWKPRASWVGPRWRARLHLAGKVSADEVAGAAGEGAELVAGAYDVDGRANVDFDRAAFREYAARLRASDVGASLAVALTAEAPLKRDGVGLQPAPLVMMFGQGWQNFLERLVAVPRGDLPNRFRKQKRPPNMREPKKVAEALFHPWQRSDDADAFRWDPNEDQRYALRFDDPSAAGAAPTVIGANRLAAVGLLSFSCFPASRPSARGAVRSREGVAFVWPIWSRPLTRASIERLLNHPAIVAGDPAATHALGVTEVYRARRISNGKFMNVTRALPVSERRDG